MNFQSVIKFRRLVAWTAGPCLPAWGVLALLALFDRLTWWDALLGSIAVCSR